MVLNEIDQFEVLRLANKLGVNIEGQDFSQQKNNNLLRQHNMDNSSNTNNKSQQTMYQRQYNQNPFTSYPRGFQNKYWRNQNQNTQRFNNW